MAIVHFVKNRRTQTVGGLRGVLNYCCKEAKVDYAEAEPRIGRVQLIHPSKDPAGKTRLKRLDLSKGSVRNKVLQVTNNDDLAKIFDTDGFFE